MINSEQGIHWNLTASPSLNFPSLEDDISVDTAIIGGGLTGCCATLELANNGMSVALLETNEIGWGASGRSGGQCNPIWRETPQELILRLGKSQANRLIQATLTSADNLFKDIEKYRIPCNPVQTGWLQCSHSSSAQKRLEYLGKSWTEIGSKIEFLEGSEVKHASGSSEYNFALCHAAGGHVQPLSLTRGYASTAHSKGALIFQNSSVKSLRRCGEKWKVISPSGSITAKQVVLATNAYSKDLWSGIEQTFLPMVSIMLVTEPLSKELQAEILPSQITLSDTRLAIYFSRYECDGRLIFGCVGSADRVATLGGNKRLIQGLHTVFPQLRNTKIERVWSGRIAVTPEMMPHLHEPEPGILAALGYSGRGVLMTSVMAKTLAAKILGADTSDLAFPISPIKPIRSHNVLRTVLPLAAPIMTIRDKIVAMIN